jgi:YD repeat-containing protein
MRFLASIIVTIASTSSFALVDMHNANFAETWTDIVSPGVGYDLKIQRTYNSRSLFSGIFGHGWCSDYETTLSLTAEGTINITECGAGAQITYAPKDFSFKAEKDTVKKIMDIVREKNKDLPKERLTSIEADLKSDTNMRTEWATNLKIIKPADTSKTFYANGRQWENIRFDGTHYIRTLSDQTFQKFNKDGQLVALHDKNRNFVSLKYEGKTLQDLVDNKGRRLQMVYGKDKRLKEIRGPKGLVANYTFEGDDLVAVTNAWKNQYKYALDEFHNLVKITYPNKTTKEITYDTNRDRVIQFKDQKDCIEKYDYQVSKKNPKDHFWATVHKTCGKKVVNRSRYEFWYKQRSDGARFLERALTRNNEDLSDIRYHPQFGRPVYIKRNGLVSRYQYSDLGQVISKDVGPQKWKFSYNPKNRKVSKVVATFKPPKKGEKTRRVTTDFNYDAQGNLTAANNSLGQSVLLSYDSNGRIIKILDQSKKVVLIRYDETFSKPSWISREGMGAITIKYNKTGEIDQVDSDKGPRVAVQVASTFNNLLEIIGPATNELIL